MFLRSLAILFVFFYSFSVYGEDFSVKVKKPVRESIEIRQRVQKYRKRWHKEYEALKKRYEELEHEVSELSKENERLSSHIKELELSINKNRDEIEKLRSISSELLPFLYTVYNGLDRFLKNDVPFLKEEREGRLFTLKRVLDDPMISIGEKFRKVMEALFIEAEYGNTVEVYKDKIRLGDRLIEGNIFRLGRIALFFQSPDKKIIAIFNPLNSNWERLPDRYRRVISFAIDIAEKRRPVKLLTLPIGKMKVKP